MTTPDRLAEIEARCEAAVEAVARAICKASGRCKYLGHCNTTRCAVEPEEALIVIAAHLKALEERGMVVVPREPSHAMMAACMTNTPAKVTDETLDDMELLWRDWQAMIAAWEKERMG